MNRTGREEQLLLFPTESLTTGIHGTFSPNHRQSIHRWYPYLEGFSSEFVKGLMDEFAQENSRIYDPFAGTGTTVTTAAFNHHLPYYSEINPIMRLIIECKTNGLRNVSRKLRQLPAYFDQVLSIASSNLPTKKEAELVQSAAFGERMFFRNTRLIEVVALKNTIAQCNEDRLLQNFAKLVLASIAVSCSEMKRAADLRYRGPKEGHPRSFSPIQCFADKASQVVEDIEADFAELPAAICLSNSALQVPEYRNYIDLLITSPPYINGTNYFRNTKLELWLTGFIDSDKELGGFRDQALAAGINNISKRGRVPDRNKAVELIACKLDEVAYDKRIPELIRRYFSDSQIWIRNSFNLLRPGAVAIIDIGDSRYAGVHVPADRLLLGIAKDAGFEEIECRQVRSRRAKDGTEVKQVLLVLRKPGKTPGKKVRTRNEFLNSAITFGKELPHLDMPYSSRNWGHGLHSLCSYQGKLKPAIAHFLVKRFTKPKQRVLDPLSGCGTVPLECFLLGRTALANDLQELAFVLTKAKSAWGKNEDALAVADDLIRFVKKQSCKEDPASFADFGLNGRIPGYFNEDTYKEILAARRYILKNPCDSWERAIVYACLCHILHGNRPYALSRRSHPVTPLKPRGDFEYRPLEPRLRDKLNRSLALQIPKEARIGKAQLGDYSLLRFRNSIDAVITSPPFAASTRFFSTNWMRLWFMGWQPQDFAERKKAFLERQQAQSLDVYRPFFACCARWLRPGGRLIMHVGKTARCNMAEELASRLDDQLELVHSCDEDVKGREKFGLCDQGATTSHQYLFIRRR